MKKYLEKLIRAKEAQAKEIRDKVKASTDVNEVRALGETLERVLIELQEAKDQLAKLDDKKDDDTQIDVNVDENARGNNDANKDGGDDNARALNPLASYGTRSAVSAKADQKKDMEKRLAFANFVTRGTPIPAEMRDSTTTTQAANAIPENLIDRIIEKIEAVGMIMPLITRTSYPVGQRIPVDSVKPVATWVGEGQGSTVNTKSALGMITFNEYKLRCEISMTQEVTVQTIPAFERLFVDQISYAMIKAIESKIVSDDDGTSGNPTGILYNANEATTPDAKVEIAAGSTGHLTYQTLCDAEAALPQQYEDGAKWFMSKKTFMSFVSMTDDNGQPIARINYGIDGKPERVLLGREVILTGEYLPNYTEATATADVVFAFLFKPSDYILNTSYDLGIQSKIDWDNEDHKTKAVMSVDGKVVDRNSLVKLIKKYQ